MAHRVRWSDGPWVVDWRLAESLADEILSSAHAPLDEPPSIAAIVRARLGEGAVRYTSTVPGDAALVRVNDEWRIYVRHQLPRSRLAFALAHELVEHALRGYQAEDIEAVANYGAAAILVPRRALTRVRGFTEIATAFRVSETLAALREAEVTGQPRAVVSPALVRVRGPEEWVWPSERALRRGTPGLARTRLTDDPRRFVLDPTADD